MPQVYPLLGQNSKNSGLVGFNSGIVEFDSGLVEFNSGLVGFDGIIYLLGQHNELIHFDCAVTLWIPLDPLVV